MQSNSSQKMSGKYSVIIIGNACTKTFFHYCRLRSVIISLTSHNGIKTYSPAQHSSAQKSHHSFSHVTEHYLHKKYKQAWWGRGCLTWCFALTKINIRLHATFFLVIVASVTSTVCVTSLSWLRSRHSWFLSQLLKGNRYDVLSLQSEKVLHNQAWAQQSPVGVTSSASVE